MSHIVLLTLGAASIQYFSIPTKHRPLRGTMLKPAQLLCAFLMPLSSLAAQGQPDKERVAVEVVATASEYVPRSTTISHPGHAYTDCLGDTSYFGSFHDYGDFGSVSGTANTNTHCRTTFSPPSETTLTTYRRANYTIVKGEQALYLLSCTQTWKPSRKALFLGALAGAAAGAADTKGDGSAAGAQAGTSARGGKWSDCPAFAIGSRYALTVHSASDAQLESTAGNKFGKLDYVSAAALPPPQPKPEPSAQAQTASASATAKIHVTSSPSSGEIYVDGKFFGNTPSDITIAPGEHVVRVTLGGKEWSRTVQITAGEISIRAEIPQ